MRGEFQCECGSRVVVPEFDIASLTCNRCGLDYSVNSTRPDMLWQDDPTAALALSSAGGATTRPAPRPAGEPVWAPPSVTMNFYERLAKTPSRHPRKRRVRRIRKALLAGGLLAVAAVVYQFRLDAGLLRLGSIIPAAAALVLLLQAALGHDE